MTNAIQSAFSSSRPLSRAGQSLTSCATALRNPLSDLCSDAIGASIISISSKTLLLTFFEAWSSTVLARPGSPFTQRVWQELVAIPPGITRSYADIALAIGRPSATRAVARANGANQVAIVVPCHRVIGSDGNLTGYGGGLWRKQWLIAHERKLAQFIP